jgi:hypothetical protein
MGTERALTFCQNRCAVSFVTGFMFIAGLVLIPALANAQDQAAVPNQKPQQSESFFGSVSRWLEEQTANVSASFKDARKRVEGFSNAAGDAAKTTVEGARDAADAVARIPTARAISGHEKCQLAPNGAPDCVAAANTICKAKGFGSGKSLDMTTAEVCPVKVYMSGRSSGPECTTDTFVSRALCQ